jgi:hypothetical protein
LFGTLADARNGVAKNDIESTKSATLSKHARILDRLAFFIVIILSKCYAA